MLRNILFNPNLPLHQSYLHVNILFPKYLLPFLSHFAVYFNSEPEINVFYNTESASVLLKDNMFLQLVSFFVIKPCDSV